MKITRISKKSKPSQRICCPIIVVQITEFQNDENSIKKSQLELQMKISSQFIPLDAVQNVCFVKIIKARKRRNVIYNYL